MASKGRARALNREDTTPIVPYESTPERNIVKLDTFDLIAVHTIRLIFSTQLKNTDNLLAVSTYEVTGPNPITVVSALRYKQKSIDLSITGVITTGTYKAYVRQTIMGINGVGILNTTDSREKEKYIAVTAPELSSAVAQDGYTIRLVFSQDMEDNADLNNIASYVIAGLTVGTVTVVNPKTIDISVSKMLDAAPYTVTVSAGLVDTTGFSMDSAHRAANFTGIGILPRVFSAAATSATNVRVTFDSDMENNADFISTTKYTITGDTVLTKSLVTPVGAGPLYTSVDITVSEMKEGGSYQVQVSTVLKDLIGNTIDPAFTTKAFTGMGIAPQMTNATPSNPVTIEIIFDEPMNVTQLETAANYHFDHGMTPSAAHKIGAGPTYTTVDVTVSEQTEGTSYTVTGDPALVDLIGNTLNPLANSRPFTGAGYPRVVGASATSTTNIRVEFNKDMGDGAGVTAIDRHANYVFTTYPATAPIAVTEVARVLDNKHVDITVSGEMQLGVANYAITVSNVIDTIGNAINVLYDNAAFAGFPYDAIVLFGGDDIIGDCQDTWLWTGTQWKEKAHGAVTKPMAKNSSTMAYFKSTKKTIMFGGNSNGDETWEWDGIAETWTQKAIGAVTKPSARRYCGMAFDTLRNVIVLYGGIVGVVANDDTYEWNGSVWVKKTPIASPGGRYGHGMAYDEHRSVVVIFGGITGGATDETWEYSGTTWAQKASGAVTKPNGASLNVMAYDNVLQKVILFGNPATYNDTWSWDGATWVKLAPAALPDGRRFFSMATNLTRNTITLFGGQLTAGLAFNDETWEWGGANWVEKTVTANPTAREQYALAGTGFTGITLPQVYYAAAIDAATVEVTFDEAMDAATANVAGNYSLTIGGGAGPVVSTATLAGAVVTLDLATDMVNGDYTVHVSNVKDVAGNVIDPNPGSAGYTAVVVAAQNIVINSGGSPASDKTWLWNGTNWAEKAIGTGPAPTQNCTMFYDSARGESIRYDGTGGGTTKLWNGATEAWSDLAPGVSPTPRDAPKTAFDTFRNKGVLFGGYRGFSDTWEWTGSTGTWVQIVGMAHTPTGRQNHVLAYDENVKKVVLFGGEDFGWGRLNDTWEYNGVDWTDVTPVGVKPTIRDHMAMAYDPVSKKILMHGGRSGENETWMWDSVAGTWTQLVIGGVEDIDKPFGRWKHRMACDLEHNNVILFGGVNLAGSVEYRDTWMWNGSAWTKLAPATVPTETTFWYGMCGSKPV
jgi:hypothetical protein